MNRKRKLKLFIATSLDGFIARRNGEVDWLFHDGDYGYSEFYAGIDTVLMGNKTYEQILTFGPYPYPDKTGFVFSRNKIGNDNNVTFVQEVVPFTRELLAQPGGDVWLVGGGQIIAPLLTADLIDEFMLFVHPVLLGDGIPLTGLIKAEKKLRLVGSKSYPSGLVSLFYQRP